MNEKDFEEKLAELAINNNLCTGSASTVDELLTEIDSQMKELKNQAVLRGARMQILYNCLFNRKFINSEIASWFGKDGVPK